MSIPTLQPTLTYGALVGRVIQQLRKNAGIEQSKIAEALHISQPGYSKLESGGSTISLPQLRKIAKVLGVAPSTVMQRIEIFESQLLLQGVVITEEKNEGVSPAALTLGIGFLIVIIAGG